METLPCAASETAAIRAPEQTSGILAGADLPLVSTKQQVAAFLRCSTKHVDNLAARGHLRPTRLGRCVRYRRETVLRALATLEGPA
ncbi:MAG: helix-turn-helix domain-containing protein [Lacunisphaera sp.]|nr:helix-turn-helix domain-containing protein [Lacunisphaera sp.]